MPSLHNQKAKLRRGQQIRGWEAGVDLGAGRFFLQGFDHLPTQRFPLCTILRYPILVTNPKKVLRFVLACFSKFCPQKICPKQGLFSALGALGIFFLVVLVANKRSKKFVLKIRHPSLGKILDLPLVGRERFFKCVFHVLSTTESEGSIYKYIQVSSFSQNPNWALQKQLAIILRLKNGKIGSKNNLLKLTFKQKVYKKRIYVGILLKMTH